MTASIGKTVDGGEAVVIDTDRLVESRALLQANSGAGKSWAIRRLLEQTYGKGAQHVVLDADGEFHTLRERFDYVLAGPGGDCPADLRGAALLARRLLELQASAIINIYELGARRVDFVKLFLESLMGAPRELWHPLLVVIDEAHLFCPEAGKSASAAAVIDLMSRGRKRGFAGILATQRIAKLHKDAAAEANNKLIGRSSLDIDMKRAAAELGMSSRDDMQAIRTMPAGEFFAFGPALHLQGRRGTHGVVRVKVGEVATTHLRAGERAAAAPAPRDKLKKVLAEALANLPREAEEEAKTAADLRVQVATLQRELRAAKTAPTPVAPAKVTIKTVEKAVIKPADLKRIEVAARRLDARADAMGKASGAFAAAVSDLRAGVERLRKVADTVHDAPMARAPVAPSAPSIARVAPSPRPEPVRTTGAGPQLAPRELKVLAACAWWESIGVPSPGATGVAFMAGYSPTSSSFEKARGALRTAGFIDLVGGGQIRLTTAGRTAAPPPETPPTVAELHATVLRELEPRSRKLLQPLLDAHPGSLPMAALAEASGYSVDSSSFEKARGQLRSLGLVEYSSPGMVRAENLLFPALGGAA